MNTTTTQAQQFAAAYAATIAKRQLRNIKVTGIITKLITAGVAAISYLHQSHALLSWKAPAELAYGLPILVDLLTIACVLGLSTPALKPRARYITARVIVVPVLISATINVAGPGGLMVKLAALSLPVLIPLGELVASAFEPDFEAMDAMERAAYAVAAPTATPVDEDAKARRSEAARKAAVTRKERETEAAAKLETKRAADRDRAAKRRQEALAPVSPAPAGPITTGIHIPTANEIAELVG